MLDRREFLASVLAAAVAGRAGPTFASRAGGAPVALVTADADGHVAAVDLHGGRIVRRIPTPDGPRGIDSVLATTGIVAHPTEGAVSIIDGASLRLVKVLRSFARPRYSAPHPHGGYAYVTDSGHGELVTLDVARGRVINRLELSGPARHLGIDPSGTHLWTALGTRADEVAVVSLADRRRPRLVSRLLPPFPAHDVAFSSSGAEVWVTAGGAREIAIYGPDARLRRRIAADAAPQHVTFKNGFAYVASGDDGTLRIHRADGRPLRKDPVVLPLGSFNVANGWRRVFAPSLTNGTLCILDQYGGVRHTVQVTTAAHDSCFVVTA